MTYHIHKIFHYTEIGLNMCGLFDDSKKAEVKRLNDNPQDAAKAVVLLQDGADKFNGDELYDITVTIHLGTKTKEDFQKFLYELKKRTGEDSLTSLTRIYRGLFSVYTNHSSDTLRATPSIAMRTIHRIFLHTGTPPTSDYHEVLTKAIESDDDSTRRSARQLLESL